MIPRATIDDLLSWRPCPDYPERRIREMAGEAISFTALDVLRREDIPEEDRLWVVLRPEMVGELLIPAVCDMAERALPLFEAAYPDDDCLVGCLRLTREFARRTMAPATLKAAREEVWGALVVAHSANERAAGRAANAVVLAFEMDRAWDVATDAANAVGISGGDADAEKRWQIGHLIEMLEREV